MDVNSRDNIKDHLCPIGLDPLVDAVKLDCGNGHHLNKGAFNELMHHVSVWAPATCPLCRNRVTRATPDTGKRELVRRIVRQQGANIPAPQQVAPAPVQVPAPVSVPAIDTRGHASSRPSQNQAVQPRPRLTRQDLDRPQQSRPVARLLPVQNQAISGFANPVLSWQAPASSAIKSFEIHKIDNKYVVAARFTPLSTAAWSCLKDAGLKMGKSKSKMQNGMFVTKDKDLQKDVLKLALKEKAINKQQYHDAKKLLKS